MRPSVVLSDWSLCWWNSVCASYVSMDSRRRASSGPPARPIMFESCRMPLTVARSQCLTGEAASGGVLFTAACQVMVCEGWRSITCASFLLQFHRRPHSGITVKAVHTRAARADNTVLQIHTVSVLCPASYQG